MSTSNQEAPRIVNAAGQLIEIEWKAGEEDRVKRLMAALKKSRSHLRFMRALVGRVDQVFGQGGVIEFFHGAHLVMAGEEFYWELFEASRDLAATGRERLPTHPREVLSRSTAFGSMPTSPRALFASLGGLPKDERIAGKMVTRNPRAGESSHYWRETTDDTLPQLGVDLPVSLGGHVLFGVVPGKTRTFVQCEGAGFQTLSAHLLGHGKGLFLHLANGVQTGLVGHSRASEKRNTHYAE